MQITRQGAISWRNRLRAIESSPYGRQIPKAEFPGGVGVPSVVGIVLLIAVAIFGWIMVDLDRSEQTASQVVDSQRRLTEQLGTTLQGATQEAVTQLGDSSSSGSPAKVVKNLTAADPHWKGASVIDPATGKIKAGAGAPVRITDSLLAGVDHPVAVPVSADAEHVDMVVAAPMSDTPGSPVIAGARSVPIRMDASNASVDRAMALVSNGQVLARVGTDFGATSAGELAGRIQHDGGNSGFLTKEAGTVGQPWRSQLATFTELGGATADDIDLVVVSYADTGLATQDNHGRDLMIALVATALAGFALLYFFLVRPVRRLRGDAMAISAGALATDVQRSPVSEVGGIADILAKVRLRLGGPAQPGKRGSMFRVPAAVVVVLATAMTVAWAGYVAVTFGARPDVPQRIVDDANDELARDALGINHALGRGLVGVQQIAGKVAKNPAASKPMMDRLAEDDEIHSVSIVDSAGNEVVHSGGNAYSDLDSLPHGVGIEQMNTSGRVPVVIAHAPVNGGRTLVAEFDADKLAGTSNQFPVRLLDSGNRVLDDTGGYVAFEQASARQVKAIKAAKSQPHAAVSDDDLIATAPVAGTKYVNQLGWHVVSQQPVDKLNLPANQQRRAAMTVALLAALIAIGTGGWSYFVHVHQLRRLRKDAEAMLDDPQNTVMFPQRHDEIGAVSICLETCRQALAEGPHCLGTLRETQAAPVRKATPVKAASAKAAPAKAALPADVGQTSGTLPDDELTELIGAGGRQ